MLLLRCTPTSPASDLKAKATAAPDLVQQAETSKSMNKVTGLVSGQGRRSNRSRDNLKVTLAHQLLEATAQTVHQNATQLRLVFRSIPNQKITLLLPMDDKFHNQPVLPVALRSLIRQIRITRRSR
jgi:hypothetical protein